MSDNESEKKLKENITKLLEDLKKGMPQAASNSPEGKKALSRLLSKNTKTTKLVFPKDSPPSLESPSSSSDKDYYEEYSTINSEELLLKYAKAKAELAVATKELFKTAKSLEAQVILTTQQKNAVISLEIIIEQFKDITQQIFLVATDASLTRKQARRKIYAMVNKVKDTEDKERVWSN